MPQLDPSFWPTQIFWLFVTFIPLYVILRRAVLPRITAVLESRQRHIDSDLERAASLKEEAGAVLAEYEKTLAEARERAAAAIKETSDAMAAEAAKRQQAFAQELAEKVKAAEARIAAAREQALGQIATVAVEAAATATEKLIGLQVREEQVRQVVDEVMGGRG
ncbi:MAG: DUF507 family protein [Alphaproteobacteria bacterium]|nr:MAG: DUF507 family protein [Alphaproteobacteria bacterium]